MMYAFDMVRVCRVCNMYLILLLITLQSSSSQLEVILPHKETSGYIQKHFWDAAKHVVMQRTAPDNIEISCPKCQVEKSYPKNPRRAR